MTFRLYADSRRILTLLRNEAIDRDWLIKADISEGMLYDIESLIAEEEAVDQPTEVDWDHFFDLVSSSMPEDSALVI